MSEYIKLGDTVRFGITIHNPSGSIGQLINADETPRWFVYTTTSGDNPLMQGNFTARANLIGTYTGNFACTGGNNFVTGDYVEVHASGKVNSVVGRSIIKTFLIDDIFSVNVLQISGQYINNPLDVNVQKVANVVATSPLDVNVYSVSGVRVNNPLDVNIQRIANTTATSPLDVNVYSVSGIRAEYPLQVNTIQVSGVPVSIADDIYFSVIKFVKDTTNIKDEYVVQWFKNSLPLASGQITNPAISVYKTSDNTSLFTNKVLNYYSVLHGGLRYDETSSLAVSGEPYMVITSGTIDSATRVWNNPIGLDYL